jgi:hypothetical protein
MMTDSEKSMFDCLEYCKVSKLTEPWNGKDVYISAICKTLKSDGNNYYCLVEIDEEGKNRIVKDFGRCVAILKFEEIYPLSYLNPSYVKKFPKSDEGTANLTAYLVENGFVEAEQAENRKDLDKLNIRLAIKKQLADEKRTSKIIIKD